MLSKITTLFLCFMLLTSCGKEKNVSDNEEIIVATSADNPPYEYIQDGKVIGFDIDVINAIGKELGKSVVIKNLDFPALLPALASNNVDLVIAAVTMTEERSKSLDFSESYCSSAIAVIFKKEQNFKSLNNLHGKVIGVQSGSTWESYANSMVDKIPDIRIKSLANNLILLEELKAGNVDAVFMEEMQAKKFEQNLSDIASFVLVDTKQEFSIALPKNSSFTIQINAALESLKKSGALQVIKDKWMK